MEVTDKTAIVLGATGLTGGLLLELLLEEKRYAKVRVITRRSTGVTHPKLEELQADLLDPDSYADFFEGDDVFCCIGTTRARTPNKKAYRAIDYGIPVTVAKLCKEKGIPTLLVMSSMGAKKKSRLFYNRTKGQMEEAVLAQELPKTHLLRPSLLKGRRKERRVGEWIARQVMKIMNLVMVGPLDKYRSIEPETVAAAMIWLAVHDYGGQVILSDEIRKLGEKYL